MKPQPRPQPQLQPEPRPHPRPRPHPNVPLFECLGGAAHALLGALQRMRVVVAVGGFDAVGGLGGVACDRTFKRDPDLTGLPALANTMGP